MSQPHSSRVSILASVTDSVEGYRVVRPSAGPGLWSFQHIENLQKWLLPKVMVNGHDAAGLLAAWMVAGLLLIHLPYTGEYKAAPVRMNSLEVSMVPRLTTYSLMLLNPLLPLGHRKTSPKRCSFLTLQLLSQKNEAFLYLKRKQEFCFPFHLGSILLWSTGWSWIHCVAQGSGCGLHANLLHRFIHVNTYFSAAGTVWRGCGNLRYWDLAAIDMALRVGMRITGYLCR